MMGARDPQRRYRWWLPVMVAVLLLVLWWILQPRSGPAATGSAYSFPAMQTLNLELSEKKMRALEARREAALALGILQEDDSSWVKAKLHEGDREIPVKVRLKGDWVDHLEGDRWSWRVQVRDSAAWRGMREFSLQSPERRGNLDEWVFHKVLAAEGVLSPRYDFIHLQLNGMDLGPYAVEEHFRKELLESQHHREGPILKFDETGMWDARVLALQDSAFPYLQIPFQDAAMVVPFKEGRTLRDSALADAFRLGNRLMRQYRYGLAPPRELFDLELVATQYAWTDVASAYHSLIWHNRRYYYNPVTSKLEPVVFDAFSGETLEAYIEGPIWGYRVDGHHPNGDYHDIVGDIFFRDEGFVRAYYGALARICAPGFLDSTFATMAAEIEAREAFLREGQPGYRWESSRWIGRAAEIRQLLKGLSDAGNVEITPETWPDGSRVLRLQNRSPFHLEAGIEGSRESILLMPAIPGVGPCEAYLRVPDGAVVRWGAVGT